MKLELKRRAKIKNKITLQISYIEGMEILRDLENIYLAIFNYQLRINLYAKYVLWDEEIKQFFANDTSHYFDILVEWRSVPGFIFENFNDKANDTKKRLKISQQLENLRTIIKNKIQILRKLQPAGKKAFADTNNVIKLGGLSFDLLNGNFRFGAVKGSLGKGTQEYKVFLKLLSSPGYLATYDGLLSEVYPEKSGHFGKNDVMDLAHIIKRIKHRLRILPQVTRKNRDIFECRKKDRSYQIMDAIQKP